MQKVIRTGNSLAVVIPSRFVRTVGVKSGDYVTVNTQPEEGKITVLFPTMRQLALKLTNQK